MGLGLSSSPRRRMKNVRRAARDKLEQPAAGLTTSQLSASTLSSIVRLESESSPSSLSQSAHARPCAASREKGGVDFKFGKIMDRLVASEGMVENLTSQVLDLRSKVLVSLSTSSGHLRHEEGALLLGQIETILKDQSHLQDLTNQLSLENNHLRAQVNAAMSGTEADTSPSPHRRAALAAKRSPTTAGPSHEDIMEEFVRSVDECQGLSRQLGDKNKKLEKLSLVLASMERALVTSERQRLLAERKMQDLTAELQAAQTRAPEGNQRPASALRSPALRHKSPELNADSKPPSIFVGGGDIADNECKRLAEALAARERERDLARSQLHTALTLLERQAQLKAAISSISSEPNSAENDACQSAIAEGARGQAEGKNHERVHDVANIQDTPSKVSRDDEAAHLKDSKQGGCWSENGRDSELEALRLGSVVACLWRSELPELQEKHKRVQQALELSLSENAALRAAADRKQHSSLVAEDARNKMEQELTDAGVKERALVETHKKLDRRICELEGEVVSLRRRRAIDLEQIASLESRALVAEDTLKRSTSKFLQAQEELEMTREEKDSLLRRQVHLKNLAKVYSPSSMLVSENDHYKLDRMPGCNHQTDKNQVDATRYSVLVKSKTHLFTETPHATTETGHPETMDLSASINRYSSPNKVGEVSKGDFASFNASPYTRPSSARSESKSKKKGTRPPEWRVVGPYASPKSKK